MPTVRTRLVFAAFVFIGTLAISAEQEGARSVSKRSNDRFKEIVDVLKDLNLTDDQLSRASKRLERARRRELRLSMAAEPTADQEASMGRALLKYQDDLKKASAAGRNPLPILRAMDEAATDFLNADQKKSLAELNRLYTELLPQIKEILTPEQRMEFERRYPRRRPSERTDEKTPPRPSSFSE